MLRQTVPFNPLSPIHAAAGPTALLLAALGLAAAFLAGLLLPIPAAGQAPDSIGQGDRVRLHGRMQEPVLQGQVVALDAESVTIFRPEARDTLRVDRTDLAEAFVSTGRRGRAGRGALIGFAVLGTFGAAIIMGDTTGDDCVFVCLSTGEAAVLGYAVFGGAGAVVGAVAGALDRRDVWAPVRTTPGPRVGLGRGGSVRFTASFPL